MAEPRHSSLRLLAYAGPSIPIAALGLPLAVHLPAFYAGPMGLGLATVGTIFFIARLFDVVVDPMLGILSDRIDTRWGRRRVWVILSVPILIVSSYYIFMPTAPVTANYLLYGLFGLYLGFTMILLAHMSWGAELSDEYDERSRIQAWREGLTTIGVPLVLMLPAIIDNIGGEHLEGRGVAVMGWFIIIALPVTVFFAVTGMGERKVRPQPKISPLEAIGPLLSNRALQRLVVSDFASGFSGSALGAMFLYEAGYIWQVGSYANLLLLLYFFAGVGFIPLVLKLSYRFGKHRTLIGASLFNVAFVPTLFLIPPGNVAVACLVLVFLGVNVASPTVLYRSIMADVGDYDEVHTGQRRTGLFYALLTFSAKVGSAVAIGSVFWALDLIGFKPGAANDAATLQHVNILYVSVPFFCNLFVAAMMWGFPIGLKEQKELRRILDERVVEEAESVEQPGSIIPQ
jgi:Na+/melibiose symporter-like transporter